MRNISEICCLLAALIMAEPVDAQVYGNSRPQASARSGMTRRAGTGITTFSIGRGTQYQSTPRVIVTGPTLTQSTRRVYSNSRSPLNSYSRIRSYGVNSGSIPIRSYRTAPVIPQVYLNYGISPGWPWNYSPYPTITAPPIIIPGGGFVVPTVPVTPWPQTTIITPVPAAPGIPAAPGVPLQPQSTPAPAITVPESRGGEQLISPPVPVDNSLINNEFPAAIVDEATTPAVDRIRSLRYQASGDNAFRSEEYASAEVFYETATKTAPERRAPWIRLAWCQVAQGRFAEATVNLKKGLRIQQDPTTSWVNGGELYGDQLNSVARVHHDQLLKWLEQRPKSTDRLLLTAAFQKLTNRHSMSREVAAAAIRHGLEADFVSAMEDLTEHRAARDRPPARQAPRHEQGIQGKGREPAPVTTPAPESNRLDEPKVGPEVTPPVPPVPQLHVPEAPTPAVPAPQLSVLQK